MAQPSVRGSFWGAAASGAFRKQARNTCYPIGILVKGSIALKNRSAKSVLCLITQKHDRFTLYKREDRPEFPPKRLHIRTETPF